MPGGGKHAGTAGRKMRGATRWPIEVPVTIGEGAGRQAGRIAFATGDLSVAGAFLRTAAFLELDEEVQLELRLDEKRVVRARAKVVRIAQKPAGMGISFTKLDDKDRDAIRAVLQQRGVDSSKK
jgi:hypothetical protein